VGIPVLDFSFVFVLCPQHSSIKLIPEMIHSIYSKNS
jgi:hypothetical protein